jgi:hypothetical protein
MALGSPARELISRPLHKADAIGAAGANILDAAKMRLDDDGAVRLTSPHGQIVFEEEIRHGSRGSR